MSEPKTEKDLIPVAALVWVALITAVAVTVIDWKIKQDILRLTSTFYKVYPATMEAQGERTEKRWIPPTEVRRHSDPTSVLRGSSLDNDAGMEEEAVPTSNGQASEDHSGSWAQWTGTGTDTFTGAANNPGSVSS